MTWEPRTYRRLVEPAGLATFEVVHAETDLQISARRDLSAEASAIVAAIRDELERYVAAHPHFAESYVPVDGEDDAPAIVRAVTAAARLAAVGPMAAVAGAVAEAVARGLEPHSAEVIVENGGDLYLMGAQSRTVLLQAGDSPLSGRVAIELAADRLPLAVCTSSGKVGHSTSLGVAHALTVLAEDGALADAVATAAANVVHGTDDITEALETALGVPGVRGAVAIVEDRIGALGEVALAPVDGDAR